MLVCTSINAKLAKYRPFAQASTSPPARHRLFDPVQRAVPRKSGSPWEAASTLPGKESSAQTEPRPAVASTCPHQALGQQEAPEALGYR